MNIATPDPRWQRTVEHARALGVTVLDGDLIVHPFLRADDGRVGRWISPARHHHDVAADTRRPVTDRAAHALLAIVRDALDDGARLPDFARDVRGLQPVDGTPTPREQQLEQRLRWYRSDRAARALGDAGVHATPERIATVLRWEDETMAQQQPTPPLPATSADAG